MIVEIMKNETAHNVFGEQGFSGRYQRIPSDFAGIMAARI
jgi:hypothetical protein